MYYYNDGENEVGPFSLEKLKTIKQSGLIGDGTLVRQLDAGAWAPFSQVAALDGASPVGARVEEEEVNDAVDPKPGTASARAHNWTHGLARSADPPAAHDAEPADPATTPSVSASGWLAYPPTPWRRYAARMLDTTLNGIFGSILLGVAFYSVAPATADSFFASFDSEAGPFLDLILSGVVASFIGGALIGVTGFTLGKLIFGVKVTRLDGGKPGLGAGLSRDFSVLLRGIGLCIPVILLFTMWFSYKRLTNNSKTSWDEGRYIVWHRPSGSSQYILNVIGIVLILLIAGVVASLG